MSEPIKTPGQIAFEQWVVAHPRKQEFVDCDMSWGAVVIKPTWEAAAAAVEEFLVAEIERRAMEQMHIQICARAAQSEHAGKIFTWSDAATMVFDASRPPCEIRKIQAKNEA